MPVYATGRLRKPAAAPGTALITIAWAFTDSSAGAAVDTIDQTLTLLIREVDAAARGPSSAVRIETAVGPCHPAPPTSTAGTLRHARNGAWLHLTIVEEDRTIVRVAVHNGDVVYVQSPLPQEIGLRGGTYGRPLVTIASTVQQCPLEVAG